MIAGAELFLDGIDDEPAAAVAFKTWDIVMPDNSVFKMPTQTCRAAKSKTAAPRSYRANHPIRTLFSLLSVK